MSLLARYKMLSMYVVKNLFHLTPYTAGRTPLSDKETLLDLLENGQTRFSLYSNSDNDCTYIVPVLTGHKYADNYKYEYSVGRNLIYFYDANLEQVGSVAAYNGTPVLIPDGVKYMSRRIYYGNTQWYWNNWKTELLVYEVK